MIRINEFFCDNLWRRHSNYSSGTNYQEIEYRNRDKLPYNSQNSVFDDIPYEFNEMLRAADLRMHMGKFRYGNIQRQNLSNYDTVQECIKRIGKYKQDGNLEHIVDAFNMLRIEFYKGKLSGKKLIPIDDGEHAKEINFVDRISKMGKSTPVIHHKMRKIINITNEQL